MKVGDIVISTVSDRVYQIVSKDGSDWYLRCSTGGYTTVYLDFLQNNCRKLNTEFEKAYYGFENG